MLGKHFLWVCLLSVSIPLCFAEDLKRDAHIQHENDSVWSQGKPGRLFARRRILPHQGQHHVAFQKHEPVAPARRCGRLMDSCAPHTPCCDPCASCRCRLFNTICHCWRLGPHCPKKT
ncbi:agouti-signaling protein-like [Oncorhynchus tshawytscha]|uniref:Agouti signaling protein, nonagouti homolog (mouse) 2b n=2 Tax=Oncorhynchus TaxID=8016 RepID=A0A8C7I6N2_ONCKI|nr:agouti-signaling protein-like [Oncorhynchus tshawytscha]